MQKKSKIQNHWKQGIISFALSAIVLRSSVILISILTAQELSQEDFGRYLLAYLMIQAIGSVLCFGLPTAGTKFIAEKKSCDRSNAIKIESYLHSIHLRGILFFIPIIFIALWTLKERIFGKDIDDKIVIILTAAIALYSINLNRMGIFSGWQDYRKLTINNLTVAITGTIFIVLGARWFGLTGACGGFVAMYGLTLTQRNHAEKAITIEHGKINDSSKAEIRRFSIPAFLALAMVLPTIWACQVMLAQNESGLNQVAIYGVAFQWYNAILFFPGLVAGMTLPKISGTTIELRKIVAKKAMTINFTTSVLAACVVSAAWQWIRTFYGDIFDNKADLTIYLMICAAVINSVSTVAGQTLVAAGKMWIAYALNFFWALQMIGFSYILVTNKWGAIGIATAFIISYTTHFIFQIAYIRKIGLL